MWFRKDRRIRVILVPTTTYASTSHRCDLSKFARLLTKVQDCYEFQVHWHAGDVRPGKLLKQSHECKLQNMTLRAGALKTRDERERAVGTYILDTDAFAQLTSAAQSLLRHDPQPYNQSDIVIGVGGEVVVPDITTNEFEGDAALDAYSVIGVEAAFDDFQLDNNKPLPFQNVGMLSMRRLPYVFPEIILTDNPEREHAIAARYIINNLVIFVGSRTFAVSAWHDDITGCLNETAWVGGERESYYQTGYCEPCVERYYSQDSVAGKYLPLAIDQVLKGINAMAAIPDELDRVVRSTQRWMFWIQLAAITVAMNFVSGIIMDLALDTYDKEKVEFILHTHLKTHWIALGLAVISTGIACVLLTIHHARKARIP